VRHRLVGDIVDAYERWQAVEDTAAEQRDLRKPRTGSDRRGR
jgi:hypothetical protein